jgi:cell wall assembly regulator SMI1
MFAGRTQMSRRTPKVLGTTEDAVRRAESELGRTLPPSFRQWLLANNGHALRGQADDVIIFPVVDDRDLPTTWDSIVRQYKENWASWLENFEGDGRDFGHLLPFAAFGTGDYYCFDDSRRDESGEAPVVLWSHETGETEDRAESFADFVAKAEAGQFADE